jgi:hypothetical protein
MTSILVVPPPDEYVPQPGDVWLAGVLRPAGVYVAAPAGWTANGQVPGVVDEPSGRVGDFALFHLLVGAVVPDPFAAAMQGSVWARGVLRVYRADESVAAAAAELAG